MINTSLCYIYRGDEMLLLHRTKKKNDLNRDKWIGIGGKFEEGESPEECVLREVNEETGLKLTAWRYRGIVTFVSNRYESELMHLFTSDAFTGEISGSCDEGEPAWISREEFARLPQWEGDRIFLKLLDDGEPFFSLKLEYAGDRLTRAVLNGRDITNRDC